MLLQSYILRPQLWLKCRPAPKLVVHPLVALRQDMHLPLPALYLLLEEPDPLLVCRFDHGETVARLRLRQRGTLCELVVLFRNLRRVQGRFGVEVTEKIAIFLSLCPALLQTFVDGAEVGKILLPLLLSSGSLGGGSWNTAT